MLETGNGGPGSAAWTPCGRLGQSETSFGGVLDCIN